MIFDLLAPSQGPKGWGPKNCAVACAIDVTINSPTPHGTRKSDPWGMTQATEWKSRLICFISFISEKTHKVWFKKFWNWLCNWNLIIFNHIWPFGPSPRPQGAGQKKCCCTPHIIGWPVSVRDLFQWPFENELLFSNAMFNTTETSLDVIYRCLTSYGTENQ